MHPLYAFTALSDLKRSYQFEWLHFYATSMNLRVRGLTKKSCIWLLHWTIKLKFNKSWIIETYLLYENADGGIELTGIL